MVGSASFGARPLGPGSPDSFRGRAQQGADTGPETSQIDVPPKDADHDRHRVAVGQAATKDASGDSQEAPAQPEPDDAVEPPTKGFRSRLAPLKAHDSLVCLSSCSGKRRTSLPWFYQACCAGHEVLLERQGGGGG
jgi:hypothetical protein